MPHVAGVVHQDNGLLPRVKAFAVADVSGGDVIKFLQLMSRLPVSWVKRPTFPVPPETWNLVSTNQDPVWRSTSALSSRSILTPLTQISCASVFWDAQETFWWFWVQLVKGHYWNPGVVSLTQEASNRQWMRHKWSIWAEGLKARTFIDPVFRSPRSLICKLRDLKLHRTPFEDGCWRFQPTPNSYFWGCFIWVY